MAAMVASPLPSLPRLQHDPAAPVGWRTIAAILAAGLALSVFGWTVSGRLQDAEQAAQVEQQQATAAQRGEAVADARADQVADQRDALAAMVVYRCDTGSITDPGLCEAARRLWR